MTIVSTIITLSVLGILAAVILYVVAQKFKVHEDPRIDQVEAALPLANCGGCGYPGCRNFAEACVAAEELTDLYCPVGGPACMEGVAKILGKELSAKDPMIAVVRCNGTFTHRAKTSVYDSAPTCAIAASVYGGDTGCAYGCLSLGDCVKACKFDAIHINPDTGLPAVVEEKCTACGACVKACPRFIIELRKRGPKNRRIFVNCMNQDRGPVAKKACAVACIGCGLCVKACPFDAITLKNNLAYIDFEKCRLCRKCAPVCPTKAITEANLPERKAPPVTTDAKGAQEMPPAGGQSRPGTSSGSESHE